jgi:NAD(P)-dependent dehydrogenase (short-subunit alcohol dehydrogenase family)
MTYWTSSVAVVTGGGAGIGRALAIEASRRGARVVVSDVEADAASAVALEITAGGGTAIPLQCDITDQASIERLAADTLAAFDSVNLVCANAGVGAGGRIDETPIDDVRWIFEVNLLGTFDTLRTFTAPLRAAAAAGHRAHVLTTGSEHSLGVPPHVGPMTVYTTTKHALLGLTDCVRRDLAPSGVTASILCPGYVGTEGWNAKRNRPARFGGPQQSDPALREHLASIGQAAEDVATIAFDGMEAGTFVIVTNEQSRAFALDRCAEVERSFGDLAATDRSSTAEV